MLTLLTSNPGKYEPFAALLRQLQIGVRVPEVELRELQDPDFLTVLAHKALSAQEALGGPCLVDDSGLLLDAYPGFPGPITGQICRLLGAAGLQRLLAGTTARARMVCYIGCLVDGQLWHWRGEASGTLDVSRPVGPGPGPLSHWFLPDEGGQPGPLIHRRRALEALGRDIDRLRQALSGGVVAGDCAQKACRPACVFCAEFDGASSSIFHELLGREIPSRIIHRTDHFLIFPPLGQFVEGGLLLATREHLLSMAHLPETYYGELERLMEETSDLLLQHYGCRPLFFEHAPVAPGDKGTCCVDHAHLNVFPVRVDVPARLQKLPRSPIRRMRELAALRDRRQAYLFLQSNEGSRLVYETGIVPSQYIRRIIAAHLGMPERWHWREYLGLEELKRTLATLAGWRCRHAQAG
jgi:inosine/xanthosine triphosphate pyrophosphatase family protein/diadenosine tetraphosphate (Ap4A) HIT family hydrolase